MRLHDEASVFARGFMALCGLMILTSVVVSFWQDWPKVTAAKADPFGMVLMLGLGIFISILILIWAFIGEKRDWWFKDNTLRIRAMSLSQWQKIDHIDLSEIESIHHVHVALDDKHNRQRHWLEITLANGKRLRSPMGSEAAPVLAIKNAIESSINHAS